MKRKLIILSICFLNIIYMSGCSNSKSEKSTSKYDDVSYDIELETDTPSFAKNLQELDYSSDITVAEAFAKCENISNIEWTNYKDVSVVVSGDYTFFLNQDIKLTEKINIRFMKDDSKTCRLDMVSFEKIQGLTDELCFLEWDDAEAILKAIYNNSDFILNSDKYEFNNSPAEDTSVYQNSNNYSIPCNGNNEIAIEAANVFANKYGSSSDWDWELVQVDGSYLESDNSGTLRVTYNVLSWSAAGGALYAENPVEIQRISNINFTCTDYGSYRGYTWFFESIYDVFDIS